MNLLGNDERCKFVFLSRKGKKHKSGKIPRPCLLHKHNVETEVVPFVVDALDAENLAYKRNRGSGDGASSTRNNKLDTQFTNSLN